MAFVQVIGMFDDRAALEGARSEVISAGLATAAATQVEPEDPSDPAERAREKIEDLLERLAKTLPNASSAMRQACADFVRRGGQLLIVTVPEEDANRVAQIMRKNGAAATGSHVLEWRGPGPVGFEQPPPLPEMIREEPDAEPGACVDESSGDQNQESAGEPRNVRLFDEATGKEVGRISESELKVLCEALEEEGPDDNDFWINDDEIDDLACRPGATRHLIAVLRTAVAGRRDGIDIAFQREGENRQSLRAGREAPRADVRRI
jgi:hypothetical protein